MNTGISFIVCSLFYSILLIGMYVSKKHPKNTENKLFQGLMFSNFIGLILEMCNYFTVTHIDEFPLLNTIVSRAYLVYLITWVSLFTLYIVYVSNNASKEKNKKKIFTAFGIAYVVLFALVLFLPLYFSSETNKIYSYGPSTQVIYYASELFILVSFISMFKNAKNVKTSKYASLFAFTSGGVIIMILQSIHPEWLLMTSMETFVTFLTFSTIDTCYKQKDKVIEKKGKE